MARFVCRRPVVRYLRMCPPLGRRHPGPATKPARWNTRHFGSGTLEAATLSFLRGLTVALPAVNGIAAAALASINEKLRQSKRRQTPRLQARAGGDDDELPAAG